jgi:hypothetical protein
MDDRTRSGTALQGARCSGCAKPFTQARKPRLSGLNLFISTSPGSEGRTGMVLLSFCGLCARVVREARPFNLPALDKAAEDLEALVLAECTGAVQ